jgi:hypothetical protein
VGGFAAEHSEAETGKEKGTNRQRDARLHIQ